MKQRLSRAEDRDQHPKAQVKTKREVLTKKLQVRAVQEHRPFLFSGSSGICGESLPDRHLTTIESRTLKLGLPA